MHAASPHHAQVTAVLAAPGADGGRAIDRLVPVVYDELRALARRQLAREHRPGATLQTTALVHEAYVRLVGSTRVPARGRAYFFAAAARAMRQVLVDHARRRDADKRGGGAEPASLGPDEVAVDAFAVEVMDLDRALNALAALEPRQARVVECRFFGGLSVEETAAALEISPRTVKYDWALARAWLYRTLVGDAPA